MRHDGSYNGSLLVWKMCFIASSMLPCEIKPKTKEDQGLFFRVLTQLENAKAVALINED